MKYLQNYVEDAQTQAFKTNGAFFAFSTKQFDEQKAAGVKYANLGAGLIAPVDNVKSLTDAIEKIHEQGIAADIKENGKKAIIWRELANHEAQITYSIESTRDALEGYGITDKEINAEFGNYMDHCRENNLF